MMHQQYQEPYLLKEGNYLSHLGSHDERPYFGQGLAQPERILKPQATAQT
jgi:hypothetical protein